MKPVLFVTGHAPAYRVGALARLHELEGIELALFGGSAKHGGPGHVGELPFPNRRVRPHELAALAASSRYRAVICPTGGRLAPLATWAGARVRQTPLILWASLWAHPRSAAHALTSLPLRRLYRSADAVVTYGPHVSAYVAMRGARNVHVAAQSVDNAFWSAGVPATPASLPDFATAAATRFLFVGRPLPEKGLAVLLAAWRSASLRPGAAALVLAGAGPQPALASAREHAPGDGGGGGREGDAPEDGAPGSTIVALTAKTPLQLRELYAACDVLVVPSIATRTFREPWGLVVNEAMNQGLAVIATDAVGAAAGGLVRDERNGLIVRAGDPRELARAIERLAQSPSLRARLGAAGAGDVGAYGHDAWARGFARALASLGLSRGRW